MRERERLEDFQGGLVACRGCKRLLTFPPDPETALLCCDFAYVPTRHQVDLVIYDRVQPGEVEGAEPIAPPEPAPIPDEGEGEDLLRPEASLPDLTPEEEAELTELAATAAELAARQPARQVALKQRSVTGQFVKARGLPSVKTGG